MGIHGRKPFREGGKPPFVEPSAGAAETDPRIKVRISEPVTTGFGPKRGAFEAQLGWGWGVWTGRRGRCTETIP